MMPNAKMRSAGIRTGGLGCGGGKWCKLVFTSLLWYFVNMAHLHYKDRVPDEVYPPHEDILAMQEFRERGPEQTLVVRKWLGNAFIDYHGNRWELQDEQLSAAVGTRAQERGARSFIPGYFKQKDNNGVLKFNQKTVDDWPAHKSSFYEERGTGRIWVIRGKEDGVVRILIEERRRQFGKTG